ncbi:hypothetical protein J5N97_002108 [Dioscorea zingiberensis]|uniref:Pectinesterase n=1 Tax=Dioscorea zingiberensis TaxID=325984 RepID=A0A9D5D3G4_9LILI|nr:hypothetical protein J5N97_002108 [Dioscorea zingiberensis]
MESINSFKGYGKVSEAEDRDFRRKTRRRLIFIIVALVLLLVIVVGVTVGTIVSRKHNNDGGTNSSSTPSTSMASSIKAMCKVTRYPDSCFSSLSSAEASTSTSTSDPEELFKLSIRIAMDTVSNLSSLPDTLSVPANDKRLRAALDSCKELFEDAVDHLNTSLASLSPAPGEKLLTSTKMDDLKTWLSAAITDQATCLDGFEGTVGDAGAKMEAAMKNSTEFTSNALAIAAGIFNIMDKLKFPVHRKLLTAVEIRTGHGFPHWVSEQHRRALLEEKVQTRQPNVTVAKDGSGDVMTVGEAVAMVPKKNKEQFVIYVKGGMYVENVVVDKNKWNVFIYGDGMDKTIISGSRNFIDGTPTFATATFVAVGRSFIARDIGFQNTAGPEKHQAVALRAGSDRSVFYKCSFDGYQDTLYAHSQRQFYRDCDISGTIDFIFGDSSVVFQSCRIRPRQPLPNQFNTITAQGRTDPNENTGISIQSSSISPLDTVNRPTYLGRPWKPYSTTIIMQTEISAVVDPAGWLPWVSGTVPPDTISYAEYSNTGPGADVAGRVKWPGYQSSVSAEVAQKFTVSSFIRGDEWLPGTGVEFLPTLHS